MLLFPVACSTPIGQEACDCADATLTLNVPTDVAAEVLSVTLSGTACAGVTPVCATSQAGCTAYRFSAPAAGTCGVEVDFANGDVFKDDVTITSPSGCCPGYYASPLSAATIDVPEPTDGGAG
jgi:hypothetical protein